MSFRLASLAAAAVAILAAGCGAQHTSSPTTGTQSLAAQWHRVVVCARTHGMPNLPDPQINAQGKAIFPSGLNVPNETRRACQAMFDRLAGNSPNHEPTPAELAALLQFARCMRSHGVNDWPDPRPDGTFHPDARLAGSLKSAFRTQLMACSHLNPDPHGRVYFSRS